MSTTFEPFEVLRAPKLQQALDELVAAAGGDASGTITRAASDAYQAAVARSMAVKLGEHLDFRDLGLGVGTGGEDAHRIQPGLYDLGASGGGTVHLNRGTDLLFGQDLIVPRNIELRGARVPRGDITPSYIGGMQGVITLDPVATISIGNAGALRNLGILRAGLQWNLPIAAALAAMQGTAVTIRDMSADMEVSDCIILGFAQAIASDAAAQSISGNTSRGLFFRVRGDCKAGILLANSYDITTIAWCHFWPYTTLFSPGAGDTAGDQLKRPGAAYRLMGVNDWTQMVGNFSFGYYRGEYITDSSSVTSLLGKHDHVPFGGADGSIGFAWDGNALDCCAISPQTAGKDTAFYNATSNDIEIQNPKAWEFRSAGVFSAGAAGCSTTARGGFLRSSISGAKGFSAAVNAVVAREGTRLTGTLTEYDGPGTYSNRNRAITPQSVGTIGTDPAVNRTTIQRALDTGANVFFPRLNGGGTYDVADTLTTSRSGQQLFAEGPDVMLRLVKAVGSPVVPILYVSPDHAGVGIRHIGFDHNSAALTVNDFLGGNAAGADAVILMGDYPVVDDVYVTGAYGNGIGVMRYSLDGTQTNSAPTGACITRVRGYRNGLGPRTPIGPLGATVNIVTSVDARVDACIDYESSLGFIFDFAGGASGTISNCIAYNNKHAAGFPISQLSGSGFYFGSGPIQATACQARFSENVGFAWDVYSTGARGTSLKAYATQREGFKVLGTDTALTDCEAYYACIGAPGTLPAFRIGAGLSGFPQDNIRIRGCDAVGPHHKYGLEVTAGGACTGYEFGCTWTGSTAPLLLRSSFVSR